MNDGRLITLIIGLVFGCGTYMVLDVVSGRLRKERAALALADALERYEFESGVRLVGYLRAALREFYQ